MAYTAGNLVSIANAIGWNEYYYNAGSDAIATVNTAGYFNNTDDQLNLAANDIIHVKASDVTVRLRVVSVSSGSVTTDYMVDQSPALIAGGATITLSRALHDNKTVVFDTAAGTIMTLPASAGNGAKYRCVVSVLATSNSHVLKCAGTDMFQGAVGIVDTDTADATIQFAALVGDTFDTITMNRTTTGLAAPGDWVEVEDIVTGVWAVKGVIRADGTVATPFSST